MSLHRFHIFFVLTALTGILLLSFSIDHLLQKNIDTNVENGIKSTSVEISEQMHNNLERIQQKFSLSEKVTLRNVQELADYVAYYPNDMNLTDFAGFINTSDIDGYYEAYIINEKKVVEKSTNPFFTGFDFKTFPYYVQVLDQLKAGKKSYHISAMTIENSAMELRKYYLKRGAGNYWVAIGHVIPIKPYAQKNLASLHKIYPALKKLDVFIVTPEYVQHINKTLPQQRRVAQMLERDVLAASMIFDDLGLPKCSDYPGCQTIFSTFQNDSIIYLHEDVPNLQTVYALVNRTIRAESEDFLLIARMQFDPRPFLDDYTGLKRLLYFFIIFILTSTVLSFMLIYRSVIKKITDITRQIQKDEPIFVSGHLFNEFKYLIQRYNDVLLRWKEKLRRLNEISMQDELTKCYNRRYFNQRINRQIELYQRYGHTFSMMMFDIDDFKKVNDTYGHSVGDYVLSSIASDVKTHIRTSDILCRIGGEEFAVILPEIGLESAAIVAEKIRSAIESENYVDGEKITVSVGVGSFKEGDDFNAFYRAVDSLLYDAKENGKNRVHLRA